MAEIAIIGAGMAGATAARAMHAGGHTVRVFDKGRNPGGRLANRRLSDGLRIDHGAQYATARDPRFEALMRELVAAGSAAPWGEPGWFVGTPTMTDLARALLAGIDLSTGCQVTTLARDGAGWRLRAEERALAETAFDAVLVTAPAPQAAALIAATGADWPGLAPALGGIRYAPCWTLMLAHDGGPLFSEACRRAADAGSALAWIARDATKPGREAAAEILAIQAGADWSRAHLEVEPDAAAALLLTALRAGFPDTAPGDAAIRSMRAHRWRYARVETAAGAPCLWSPDLRLGVAGDGFLGPRVEAAYLSGLALAEAALAAL